MLRRPDPVAAVLWIIAALLAAGALGIAAYKASVWLHPVAGERAPLNPDCDLRAGPCTVSFADGGQVTLDIEPRGVPSVQPLSIRVGIDGLSPPARLEVDFAGVDMDMGFNRVELAPAPAATGSVHWYQGRGMLPVCVRERMTWEARVLLYDPDGLRAAPFRFETLRPGVGGVPDS